MKSTFQASFFVGLLLAMVAGVVVAQQDENIPKTHKETGEATHVQQDDAKSSQAETALYMQAKLANCEKVLKGLVTEDFQLVNEGANQMKKISQATHWPKSDDQVYQHYSVEFRRQCDKLVEQALSKDLQAAHYSYLHLSSMCIDCHSYVRGRFKVQYTKQGAPVQLIPTQWDHPKKIK